MDPPDRTTRVIPSARPEEGHLTALDRRLAAFADVRHGVVTRSELRRAGYSNHRVDVLLKRGTLHRLHQGVYAVGRPTPSARGAILAAVLAVGGEAAAAQRSGAALRRLGVGFPTLPHVVTTRSIRRRDGLRLHRTPTLLDEDVSEVDGIPCLSVTRLILDAVHARDRSLVERLWRQSRRMRELDEAAVVARLPGRRGQHLLADLLTETEPDTTNDFERTVYGLLDRLGLGEPEREVPVGRFRMDFFFPELRWCVEADSVKDHGTVQALVDDRNRDRELYRLHGILTHRIMWQDAHRHFDHVQAQLRDAARVRAREVSRAGSR